VGRLTTHVLDTSQGCPGVDIETELYRIDTERRLLKKVRTNGDGRTDRPLLEGAAFEAGRYELVFSVGPYFKRHAAATAQPPFLDEVIVRFGVCAPAEHYHVPLLVSPWSYTTYRGS